MANHAKGIQPDWLGKSLAGLLPGLALAFVCVGFTPGTDQAA